jgi:hypothetical protein
MKYFLVMLILSGPLPEGETPAIQTQEMESRRECEWAAAYYVITYTLQHNYTVKYHCFEISEPQD